MLNENQNRLNTLSYTPSLRFISLILRLSIIDQYHWVRRDSKEEKHGSSHEKTHICLEIMLNELDHLLARIMSLKTKTSIFVKAITPGLPTFALLPIRGPIMNEAYCPLDRVGGVRAGAITFHKSYLCQCNALCPTATLIHRP